jgi:hypothetical protein
MIKHSLTLLVALLAASSFAQTDSQGVTTSTDPAKIAAIERHADELRARGQGSESAAAMGGHGRHVMKHRSHQRYHTMKKSKRTTTTTTTSTTKQ